MSLTSLCLFLASAATVAAPLQVDGERGFTRDGRPYRAIGVNYYDAFVRTLEDPDDTSYVEGFAVLRNRGIPFARISIAAYWAKGLELFRQDREGYLRRLDGVVRAAEEHGIGLVPSFFWAYWTVPDLMGEPVQAWGKSDSATHSFMRDFTQAVVTRYKDSPAIWMWEFGNEFNLSADLPLNKAMLPPAIPAQGTPAERDVALDLLTTDDVRIALTAFAQQVRSIDPVRPITSGHAVPRPHAESLRATRGWGQIDSREVSLKGLQQQHPDGINVASIHVYPESVNEARFRADYQASYAELFSLYNGCGKPLFLGEFGAFIGQVPDLDTEEKTLGAFRLMLDAMIESSVPLAAAWNFFGAESTGIRQQPWNFDHRSRSGYLDAVAEANQKISISDTSASD